MNNGKEVLIFHSPVLITIQFVEGEITHWSNFSVRISISIGKKRTSSDRDTSNSMKHEH